MKNPEPSSRLPADDGLFGPASVTWRVHASPAMIIGGMRALVIESLHPLAMAGVAQHSDYATRGLYRLRRTIRYILTVTYGDTRDATEAGALVRKVHERIQGLDPVTGKRYRASDPETLLWVHCVELHSFLLAYTTFGGRLSPSEQDRYFEEGVRSAALVGIPAEMVPKSRREMREYFARVRPMLCVSEAALSAIRFVVSPPITREHLAVATALRVVSRAAIGLVPGHLRALAGLERPRTADVLTLLAVRAALTPAALAMGMPLHESSNVERIRRIAARNPFAGGRGTNGGEAA